MQMSEIGQGEAQMKVKRINKKKVITIAGVIGGLILVLGFSLYLYKKNHLTFQGYDVIKKVERADSGGTKYINYGNHLIKYGRDGASAISPSGEYLWNGSYEMKDPVIDICEDYVVIGDRGGNLVHIFNYSKGAVTKFTVTMPILKVSVASQGVVAVMMEAETSNYIQLYNINATVLAEKKTSVISQGYPLDMALSRDGTKLVTSYMKVSAGKVETNIGYYNFGEVGASNIDRLVGGTIYEDTVITKVKFVNNNTVCLYKQNGFVVYEMDQKPGKKPIFEKEYEEEIQSILSSKEYVGCIQKNTEGADKYLLELYDLKGNKVVKKGINFEYTNVFMTNEDIVLYNYAECLILTKRGEVKFQYKFNGAIESIYSAGKNRYYIVAGPDIKIIVLKEEK